MMRFDIPKELVSIIKVIGVGGGGSNAVNHMFRQGISGVDFIICNTDIKALESSPVPIKVQLGKALTQGLGAGSLPEVGMKSAIESLDQIKDFLSKGTKMVFITAGMGGGTGTGAAPIIAQTAREMGVLTVAITTLPFAFEGKNKRIQAEEGIESLKRCVDCLLVITNDKLRQIYGNLGVRDSFAQADNVLANAARSIAELISFTKHMNVDFNDVHTAMKDSGVALMGTGTAGGTDRAMKAVELAMNSPLLNDNEITGAKYVLLDITSGTNELTMDELGEITDFIQDATGSNADIKIGYGIDETLGDKVNVTIIATGFKSRPITVYDSMKRPEKRVHKLEEEKKIVVDIRTKPMEKLQAEPVVEPTETPLAKTDAPESFSNLSQQEKDKMLEPVLLIKPIEIAPVVAEETIIPEITEPILPVENTTPVAEVKAIVTEDLVSEMGMAETVEEDTVVTPVSDTDLFSDFSNDNLFDNETFIEEDSPVAEPEAFVTEATEEKKEVEIQLDFTAEEVQPEPVAELPSEEVLTPVAEETPLISEEVLEELPEMELKIIDTPVMETPSEEVKPDMDIHRTSEEVKPQIISREKKEEEIVAEEKKSETLSNDSQIRKAQERINRLKELSYKLKTPSGLAELENEPAYKRKGINLDEQQHSTESQVSRYTLSEGDDKKAEIKPNNSFLHDNVD